MFAPGVIPYLLVAVAAVTGAYLSARVRKPDVPIEGRFRSVRERMRGSTWTSFDVGVVVLLVAFSGARYFVGTDYAAYARVYDQIDYSNWSRFARGPLEVGYTALMLFLKMFVQSPVAFFATAAAMTVIPAYVFLKRWSLNLPISVAAYMCLGFYFAPMNVVRQGIAVSLLLLASTYLGRSWLKFLVLAAIAVSLHSAALFAVIAFALLFVFKPTLKQSVIFAAIVVPGFVALIKIPVAVDALAWVSPNYAVYLRDAGTGIGSYLVVAVTLALLVYATITSRAAPQNVARERWMFAMVLIGIAFMVVGTQLMIVFRMSMYFAPFLMILVPNAIVSSGRRARHIVALAIGGVLYAYMYLVSYGGLLPYQTYFYYPDCQGHCLYYQTAPPLYPSPSPSPLPSPSVSHVSPVAPT